MAGVGRYPRRANLSSREPRWTDSGAWDHRKGSLACGEASGQSCRHCEACAARFAQVLRPFVPECWWGARTDSVASWDLSVQTTERYLGSKQRIRAAVNDRIGI